ncbi:hypothetical protein DL96DRAFT_1551584 [Flagelloscypha sp. PMI_526]|nr:hypothetical protein DL96DRAFT_1551584 [Flagelloscypha sp. PMI_526]
MSFPTFPQELVDQVIDHLWDEPEQLKACTLTSHSFTHSSQLHLFENVYLDTMVIDGISLGSGQLERPSPTRFLELLVESPHIIPFVKTLQLGFHSTVDPALPAILKSLTHVQSFSLEGPLDDNEAGDFGFRAWEDLSEPLKEALAHFMSVSPLKELSLDTAVNLPTSLFRLIPQLSSLSLTEAFFEADDIYNDDFPPPSTPIPLKNLNVDAALHCDLVGFLEPMTDAKSALDLTRLESLSVTVDIQDLDMLETLQQLLDANQHSLESFCFNPDHLGGVLSLSNLHSLHTLALDFAHCVSTIHDPIPWVLQVLSTTNASSSTLTTLHFHTVLQDLHGQTDISPPWGDLDNLIAEDRRFRNLSKCTFTVDGPFDEEEINGLLRQQMAILMPKAAAKGLIA